MCARTCLGARPVGNYYNVAPDDILELTIYDCQKMLNRTKLGKFIREPPIRLLFKALYGVLPVSIETRALWDISSRPYPHYLNGVLLAAQQAVRQNVEEISVVEFGVAGGNGLVALQEEAAAVERETGVRIKVFGFDNGPMGLPSFIGDHRDHPDAWNPGDYPMDEVKLRARLAPRTTLILGNVRDTVPAFVNEGRAPPIGFMSVDVDLYSSTIRALDILSLPRARMLHRVFIYFDDIELTFCHRFAGELLAIDEFNQANEKIKIDRLRGFASDRPFPEKQYLKMMYVAHDLRAISSYANRPDPKPLMTHTMR
jgi:hypothetical protein